MMICAFGRAFDSAFASVAQPCNVRLCEQEFEYGFSKILKVRVCKVLVGKLVRNANLDSTNSLCAWLKGKEAGLKSMDLMWLS